MFRYKDWTENKWKCRQSSLRKPKKLLLKTTFKDDEKVLFLWSRMQNDVMRAGFCTVLQLGTLYNKTAKLFLNESVVRPLESASTPFKILWVIDRYQLWNWCWSCLCFQAGFITGTAQLCRGLVSVLDEFSSSEYFRMFLSLRTNILDLHFIRCTNKSVAPAFSPKALKHNLNNSVKTKPEMYILHLQ